MKIFSFGYFLLRVFASIPYRLFYRKIKVYGKDNIPKNKPVIFAPNHQNALMDPLAMVFSTPKQIVFLARGDIFKGSLLTNILTFLRILPVYRKHDGKAALKKNDEVFAKSVDYLQRSGAFCLFPEAQHNPHRNLRPLKKGIPRIAFQALQATDFEIDIQIVPTGIYYEDKDAAQSYLQVTYGKPIAVKDYIQQIKDNEPQAMWQLSKDMSPRIKPLILDIPENDDYDLLENIRSIHTDYRLKKEGKAINDPLRFEYDQKLIAKLNHKDIPESIRKGVRQLTEVLEQEHWHIKFLHQNASWFSMVLRMLILLVCLPLSCLGYIINALPFFLRKYICQNLIKDPQFISSVKFVIGGIVMPVYFLLIALISLIFLPAWQSLILLLALPLVAYFSYYTLKQLKVLLKRMAFKSSKRYQTVMQDYQNLNEAILEWTKYLEKADN